MDSRKRDMEQEVLFQKLGTTWYAFTEINSDVVYSPLPVGVDPHNTKLELYHIIEKHLEKVARFKLAHDISM
jgi:hypothetical protein